VYTHEPPELNPINNPPRGFDPENPPNWGGIVSWAIAGALGYELYESLKLPETPKDNLNKNNNETITRQ